MTNILTTDTALKVAKELAFKGSRLVLVGGCFDILHIGHIRFLEEAKAAGDILFVMLEHDVEIKKRKGLHRPVNTQKDRAEILSRLQMVDFVITLPPETDNTFYDGLVNQLKPAIIATTAGDPYRKHKERQAKQVKAKVIDVIDPISNKSTTRLVNILNEL